MNVQQKIKEIEGLTESLIGATVDYQNNKTPMNLQILQRIFDSAMVLLKNELKKRQTNRPQAKQTQERPPWIPHFKRNKKGGGDLKQDLLKILKKTGPENILIRIQKFEKLFTPRIPVKSILRDALDILAIAACITAIAVVTVYSAGFGIVAIAFFGGIALLVFGSAQVAALYTLVKRGTVGKNITHLFNINKRKKWMLELCQNTGNIMKTIERLSETNNMSSSVLAIVLRVIFDMEADLIPKETDTELHPFLSVVVSLWNQDADTEYISYENQEMVFDRLIYFPHNTSYKKVIQRLTQNNVSNQLLAKDILHIYIQASSFQYALCGVRAPLTESKSINDLIRDIQNSGNYPFNIDDKSMVETNFDTLDKLWKYDNRANVCEGLDYWKRNNFINMLERQKNIRPTIQVENPGGVSHFVYRQENQSGGRKKKMSAYHMFMSKHLRAGKKMKEIAEMWNEKKK